MTVYVISSRRTKRLSVFKYIFKQARMTTFGKTLLYAFIVCSLLGPSYGRSTPVKNNEKTHLTPVVIIPGHGGNQMNMKVERDEPVYPGCPTSTDGFVHGWLSLWHFLPNRLECWVRHNKVTFDEENKKYYNMDGVEHEIPGWGKVETIEYLDASITAYLLGNVGSYFAPIIRKMEEWGYTRNVNVRGAPYDFRYSPTNMPNFHDRLRDLIEQMYEENDQSRVALLCHSMGGLMGHYFLDRQEQEWKDKYIHSFTTMSTPWKGVVSMAEAIVSGYTWGIDGLHPNTFRILQRSCESSVFLLPSPSAWGPEEPLVETPEKNYTSEDYAALYKDLGFSAGITMREIVKGEMMKLNNPGVDTWCYYGSGVATSERLRYNDVTFPDGPPERVVGDGDGTANIRSASACKQWEDTPDHLVVTREIKNTEHNGILSSEEMFTALKEILGA